MTPSRTWVPLVAAAKGDYSGEIISEDCPAPLTVATASNISSYVNSFHIESFRTLWARSDAISTPTGGVKDPSSVEPPDQMVTTSPDPSSAARTSGWEIALTAVNADGVEDVLIGFNMRPRLSHLRLYTYVHLLMSERCRSKNWGIWRHGTPKNEILDWKSSDLVEPGSYMILNLDSGLLMVISLDQLIPRFTTSKVMSSVQKTGSISVSLASSSGSESVAASEVSEPAEGSSLTFLPASKLREAVNKTSLRARDRLSCQITGHCWPGSVVLFKGGPTMAHIIPMCRTDIIDRVRWTMDPRYRELRGPIYVRRAAASHLSNLMLLTKSFEELLDSFGVVVDPFGDELRTYRLNHWSARREIPDDEEIAYTTHSGRFPHPPRASRRSPPGRTSEMPGVSTMSLFLQLNSALHRQCAIPDPRHSMAESVRSGIAAWRHGSPLHSSLDFTDQYPADTSELGVGILDSCDLSFPSPTLDRPETDFELLALARSMTPGNDFEAL